MNRKIPIIAHQIFTYGSYARPLLNYSLSEKIDKGWKHYFQALRYSWSRKYPSALLEIERGLKHYNEDRTLYYLLWVEKLFIFQNLKPSEGDMLYEQLKKEIHMMPSTVRNDAASALMNYYALSSQREKLSKPRFWSKSYEIDKSTQVFMLLGEARNEVKHNLSKTLSLFSQAVEVAEGIPHPTGLINGLNDLAWYQRESQPLNALAYAEKANYCLGYYREDIESFFFVIDTLFEVQRLNKDMGICKTAEIATGLSESLSKVLGISGREQYKKMLILSEGLTSSLDTSLYSNTLSLRKYLKRMVTTSTSSPCRVELYNIFKGKVKLVRGHTLQKLIQHLNFKIDLLTTPLPLLQEAKKLKIEEELKDNLSKLASLSPSERIILFFSTYMVLSSIKDLNYLKRRDILSKVLNLLMDNRKPFFNFLSSKWETKEFLFSMFNTLHPLLEGRRDLAKGFLKRLSKKRLISFLKTYASLNEDSRQILNTFIRNYSRYDRGWRIRLSSPESIKSFSKAYNLSETRSTLAYYAWDKERERKRFISLLDIL